MAPDAYSRFKRDLAVSALERAGLEPDVGGLVSAHGNGRRRVTLHATKGGAGFMGLRSHDIDPIESCPILVPALKDAPRIAREIASVFGPCDVAFTASESGLDVNVRAKGVKPPPQAADLARRHDLARLSLNEETLYTVRAPVVTMGKALVPLPVASFLQATAAAEAELAARVLAAAKGFKSVADLFCGVGPFALRLAANAPVLALDSDRPAIDALARAARATPGLKPIIAERRDLFGEPMTPYELDRFDCVVLDPPRAGAKAQAQALVRAGVRRIVYVSCDPQSFARDAAILIGGGYGMGEVTPIDQFAWSAHVELVAVFDRSAKSKARSA